jgi:hypothetical protein
LFASHFAVCASQRERTVDDEKLNVYRVAPLSFPHLLLLAGSVSSSSASASVGPAYAYSSVLSAGAALKFALEFALEFTEFAPEF